MKSAKNRSVAKRSKLFLVFGFLFFINPCPLGFDILPDVFGAVLIFFGLTQLAYFDGSAEKAKNMVLYLSIVEMIKLFFMESTATTLIPSNRMLSVTSFSIVEGILYILFFRAFFEGVSYFSMRNNCNETLKKVDGTAFLSYLAFFVRIAATLLPELLAILELSIYTETDFDVIDSITDIISAKPVIVVLVSLIALVTGIAWFVSICGLLSTFFKESSEILDERYISEYISRPEIMRPKKLKQGSCGLYFAFFFALDLVFDGIRIVPSSAMFLFMFGSVFLFRDIFNFKETKRFSVFSFIALLGTEIFRALFVPNGAIVIYETDLWIIAVGALIALVAAPLCLLTVRFFLSELRALQQTLGGSEIFTTGAWVSYCIMLTLWAAGFIVPYFYSFIASARFIAAGIFIWQTSKIISQINDEEIERVSLYGK